MKKTAVLTSALAGLCIVIALPSCSPGSSRRILKNAPSIDRYGIAEDIDKMETVTYLAVFSSMNTKVAGNVTGSFTFHKDRDFIVADLRVSGSAPNVIHAQNIHLGTACPTEAADTNVDGVVDIIEAQPLTGNIIVPLDGDINSQYSLLGMFPIADQWGSYFYSQTASFQRFLDDLKDVDEDTTDEVVKLGSSPLELAGKVVMIYGIADDVILAESVATNGGLSGNQTLPIACGVINMVTEIPGNFEPDDMPVGTTRSGNDTPGTTRPGTVNTRPGTNNSSGSNNGRTSPMGPRRGSHGSEQGNADQSDCPVHDGKNC